MEWIEAPDELTPQFQLLAQYRTLLFHIQRQKLGWQEILAEGRLQPIGAGEQKTSPISPPTCENTVNVGVTPEGTLRREDSGGWDDP